MIRIAQAIAAATRSLADLQDAAPRMEAELLLAEVLYQDRTHLMAWPERPVPAADYRRFQGLVERRSAGEPIAYILGHREFWSLDLLVTPDVLIPRPETELLVELALQAVPAAPRIRAADLGTGCGAIAAALARERPGWALCATDNSAAALAVARQNFARYRLTNIEVRAGDWCAALPPNRRYDLILSNPPYVPTSDPHLQHGDVRFEPRSALAAGADGLDAIRRVLERAPRWLAPHGLLLLEHGFDQGEAVRRLLGQAGLERTETHRDLAGLDRVSGGRRPAHGRPGEIRA